MYTQCEGLYLGDTFYDPIFAELDRRNTTVFVHPVAPVPEVKLKGVSSPAIEYTFDTTRTIANLAFTSSRKRYPNIKFIFSHGGGTVPFLTGRIAGQASLPFQGGRNPTEVLAEMKDYYYDLAAVTTTPQLAALNAFVGASRLVTGSDGMLFPLAPTHGVGDLHRSVCRIWHASVDLLLTTQPQFHTSRVRSSPWPKQL